MTTSSRITNAPRITGFETLRPRYETSQRETLAWLARAHTEAERAGAEDPAFDDVRFHEEMQRRLARFGCGPESIARRGYEIGDVTSSRWHEMRVYDFTQGPEGVGTRERTDAFIRVTDHVFDRLYHATADDAAPHDLLHVTCTGYASPSAAQRLVSRRGWGASTRVVHAYQMGCYAAVPAVRLAAALVTADRRPRPHADIVHTEICSLHLHPRQHAAEQLVLQSLFADGHVRYSVVSPTEDADPAFALLGVREEILPDSADAMTWIPGDAGMEMTLARELPRRIGRTVRAFVERLHEDAGLQGHPQRDSAMYAVHPGGPRVIDAVEHSLELSPRQVAASRSVLSQFGNMSSATLPHVWKSILEDPAIAPGTPVVSLAFGPGLTMAGTVMVKT
jgi:predicted naringenin-chalcone synthase